MASKNHRWTLKDLPARYLLIEREKIEMSHWKNPADTT